MLKSHGCGVLRQEHVGQRVTLAGWVHRRRDHGRLIFLDLRDRDGIVQVVVRPREDEDSAYAVANEVRNEYVLRVTGEVVPRSEGTVNPDLPTGEVELIAERVEVLNTAKTPPFAVNEDTIGVDELVRMRYRYIDIRRPQMLSALELRAGLNQEIRNFMTGRGFLEVETPILVAATPEGARDYVVPSRLQPGAFYALPQAPQQYKQLLMVAGVERYYQIARCFRDEDLRADRQPEFTQLDLEWSFSEEEDILALLEDLFVTVTTALRPDLSVPTPFPRLTWQESIERYGSDKPDLRYGLELSDCSAIAAQSGFSVFSGAVANGGRVRGIVMPGGASLSRREVNAFTDLARTLGAPGLVSMQFSAAPAEATEDEIRSPVLRHVGLEDAQRDRDALRGGRRRPGAAGGRRSGDGGDGAGRAAPRAGAAAGFGRPDGAAVWLHHGLPAGRAGQRGSGLDSAPPSVHCAAGGRPGAAGVGAGEGAGARLRHDRERV